MSAPDWSGLLKWSLKQGTQPNEAGLCEMDPSRKEWLSAALESLNGPKTDPFHLVTEVLEHLRQNEHAKAIELLDEIIDHTGVAEHFVALGGATMLLEALEKCSDTDLQTRCFGLAALVFQNNVEAQRRVLEQSSAVPRLLALETSDKCVDGKGLSLVFTLTRDIPDWRLKTVADHSVDIASLLPCLPPAALVKFVRWMTFVLSDEEGLKSTLGDEGLTRGLKSMLGSLGVAAGLASLAEDEEFQAMMESVRVVSSSLGI